MTFFYPRSFLCHHRRRLVTTKKRKPDNSGRNQDGTFKKGVSGNPRGCPSGSRNRATIMAQKLLDDKSENIVKKAIELAEEGDSTMIRVCMERLVPQRKSFPVKISLPDFKKVEDMPAVTKAIADATSSGELTPEEADKILKIFDRHLKALELADIEARLQALEEKL